MENIKTKIFEHIRKTKRRNVFTSKDFLKIGSRDSVDQSLSRLVKDGIILKLGRGLYYRGRVNPRLRIPIPPDIDDIAHALARRTGSRTAPSAATAANRFGLSTQVPANPVYLTDSRSRKIRVGKMTFVVKHVSPKDLPRGSRTSVTVIQALRHLGKDAVNSQVIDKISRQLSPRQRAMLAKDVRYTSDWIAEAVQQIATGSREGLANG